MRIRVPHYYKEFECIGSECKDTCCAGWEVIIDDETYQYYESVSGEFGKRLKSTMISADENSFILRNGNCPFLNDNKLCDIYTELGGDKLCHTCKVYPRFIEEFGDLREVGISLSCPEAARLILKDSNPVEFELEKNSEMVTTYNDIDAELFMQLLASRKFAIKLLQNRTIPLDERIARLLSYIQSIQKKIDKNKLSKITEVSNDYTKSDFIEKFTRGLNKYKKNESVKFNYMSIYVDVYKNLENINDNWPQIIEHSLECLHGSDCDSESYRNRYANFNEYYKDKNYEYEHLMVYFIFRYFMKAVYDRDVFSKVKMAVVSYLVIKEMDVVKWIDNGYQFDEADQIEIMHLYSKEVEHSDYNLELLANLFKTSKLFNLDNLMLMLMN